MTAIPDADFYKHADRLKDAVVLITGAGSGIGRDVSLKFAKHGAKVVVSDLNLDGAKETLSQIQAAGGSGATVRCDVTVWEDQVAAFEAAIAEFGKLDVVIANAGVNEVGQFFGAPLGEDGKPPKPNMTTLDVNLTGSLYTINLAQYYLFKGGPPQPGALKSIVAISSMAAWSFVPGGILYSASKAGLLGAVRSTSQIYAKMGVRISCIHPFFVDTPILNERIRALLAGLPLAHVDKVSNAIFYAATDPDLTTHGSALMIPDDGDVYQWPNEKLKEGVYAELDARLKKVYGFTV
jgi:NAD(P)-dependent dehydrogenase (short-subunit alcohol dehydrogenase family)